MDESESKACSSGSSSHTYLQVLWHLMLMMAVLQVWSAEPLQGCRKQENVQFDQLGLRSIDPVSWSMIPCEETDRARACVHACSGHHD